MLTAHTRDASRWLATCTGTAHRGSAGAVDSGHEPPTRCIQNFSPTPVPSSNTHQSQRVVDTESCHWRSRTK